MSLFLRKFLNLYKNNRKIFLINFGISLIYYYVFRDGLKVKVLTPRETINKVIVEKKSLIRWGDADTNLSLGGSIYYQKYDPKLKKYLNKILLSYSNKSNYILAIPNKINYNTNQLKRKNEFITWSPTKYLFQGNISKKSVYGDSFIFYKSNLLLSKEVLSYKEISKLWDDVENIIFVHFDKSVYDNFKRKNSKKKVFFINSPDKNAFKVKEKLLSSILTLIKENNLDSNNVKILISAGPTARVLIYILSQKGYIGYDMGTYFGITKIEKFFSLNNKK